MEFCDTDDADGAELGGLLSGRVNVGMPSDPVS